MDFSGLGFLPDQFDSLLESNFNLSNNQNDFLSQIIENELDTNYMDELIFNANDDKKVYSVLDEDLTKELLDTFEKREETSKFARKNRYF